LFGLAAGANQRWEEPRLWGEAVGVQRLNIGSRMSREAHVRLCVQGRLACSAGDKPAGVKVRAP